MSIDLEHHLSAAMRDEADGLDDADAPTGVLVRATRNHRQRKIKIRIGYALGAAGLAAALVAGLTVDGGTTEPKGGGTAAPKTGGAPATGAEPPALRLVAAATASGNLSYRIKVTTDTSTSEGAFDPATHTGYLRTTDKYGIRVQLLINGTVYHGTEPLPGSKPSAGTPKGKGDVKYDGYRQLSGKVDHLTFDDPVATAAFNPDPAILLKTLRDTHAVITEKPGGALRFTFKFVADGGQTTLSTTGDVTIDADKRIGKVAFTFTWNSTVKGLEEAGSATTAVELSDYGLPVKVERPKDATLIPGPPKQ